MGEIKFRMAALTNVGRIRTNNEDNFLVDSDLSDDKCFFTQNEQKDLGGKGALLVVADGMGGMNAGEVASRLAVETIQEYFSAERLTAEVIRDRQSVERYMKMTIVAADQAIKERSRKDASTSGMGTTVVMAWLLKGQVYVAWCGDSRAYAWHQETGLRQLSKDHSYVQELVDNGKLDAENAFDHPDSNIITRSLGDPRKTAEPDFRAEELYEGEVILLCSDGLCGMIRDREIEAVVRNNPEDMKVCGEALIEAALQAGGHDNVTVTLCRIVSGGKIPVAPDVNTEKKGEILNPLRKNKKILEYLLGGILMLGLGIGIGYYFSRPAEPVDKTVEKPVGPEGKDSLNLLQKGIEGGIESVGKSVMENPEAVREKENEKEGSKGQQEGGKQNGIQPGPGEQEMEKDTSKVSSRLNRIGQETGQQQNISRIDPQERGKGEEHPQKDTLRKGIENLNPLPGETEVNTKPEEQPGDSLKLKEGKKGKKGTGGQEGEK